MIGHVEFSNKDLAYLYTLKESINVQRLENGKPLIEEGELFDIIDGSIGDILRAKNIDEKGIEVFLQNFKTHVEEGTVQIMITAIAAPPFMIEDLINKKININDWCKDKKVSNVDNWLGKLVFPSSPPAGNYEALLILFFNDMKNAKNGDVEYFKDGKIITIEVKGESGRIKGQIGYSNGTGERISKLLIEVGLTAAKWGKEYNFKEGKIISSLEEKILVLEQDIINQEFINLAALVLKEKKRDSKTEGTKGRANAQAIVDNFIANPPKIRVLKNKIQKVKEDIDNSCFLEKASIELAKEGKEKSVNFFLEIFSAKYDMADPKMIKDFLEVGIKDNGYFTENFFLEYIIFEFAYYMQGKLVPTEKEFDLFVMGNNKGDMLAIDSVEKFREFVEKGYIKYSMPNFGHKSGTQGEVFSVTLV